MKIRGQVWKFGTNIDTDAMYPGKYLVEFDPAKVGKHAMEGIDPDFTSKMKPGDLIVAGPNFGCGSAREQAAMTLKFAGVAGIVADSFARAFYRNAVNNALPVLAIEGISGQICEGDTLEMDMAEGRVTLVNSGLELRVQPAPPIILDIIEAGGAIPYYRHKLGIGEPQIGVPARGVSFRGLADQGTPEREIPDQGAH